MIGDAYLGGECCHPQFAAQVDPLGVAKGKDLVALGVDDSG